MKSFTVYDFLAGSTAPLMGCFLTFEKIGHEKMETKFKKKTSERESEKLTWKKGEKIPSHQKKSAEIDH